MSANVLTRTGQLKASVVMIIAAFICQCIGVATSYWMRVSSSPGFEIRMGLWNHCACFTGTKIYGSTKMNCFCISWSESVIDGWLTAVRGLEVVGLIAVFVLAVILFTQAFCTTNRSVKLWGILLAISAGACILAGVAVYGIRQMHYLNFSFWCSAVSGILCLLSTFLLVSDRKLAFTPQTQTCHVISNQEPVISCPSEQQLTTGYPSNYAPAQFELPPSYTTLPRSGSDSRTVMMYGAPPPYSEVQDKT